MAKNVKVLKIKRDYLDKIVSGEKPFEIRFNDRDYKVGDVLVLRDFDRDFLEGTAVVEVTYILDKFDGLTPGFVAMSIELVWTNLKV